MSDENLNEKGQQEAINHYLKKISKNPYLSYLPGFRSQSFYKALLASFVYALTILILFISILMGDVGIGLFTAGFVAVCVSILGILTASKRGYKTSRYVIALFLSFIILIAGGSMMPTSDDVATDEPKEETEVATMEEEKEEEETEEEKELEMIDIDMESEISFENDSVVLSGTANFKDGTELVYEVENFDNLDDFKEGKMIVEDGEFEETVDISDFSEGEIIAWVSFQPFNQPEKVQETYGEEGEYIEEDLADLEFETTHVRKEPFEFSGTGDTVTDNFGLDTGLAILELEHTGASNFIVEINNSAGTQSELMVNEIGNYSGTTLTSIDISDEYYLEVEADGSWEGTLTQMIPKDNPDIPETFTGQGDEVIFVDMEPGNIRFDMSHEGQSNFIVTVNDQHLLANDIGVYEGSATQPVQDTGTYVISVEADGKWSISLEEQ